MPIRIQICFDADRAADPHHLNADPDPGFHFNADLDPGFHLYEDPDPYQSDRKFFWGPQASRPFKAPF